MLASAVPLAAQSPMPQPPEFGWRCYAQFDVEGHRVTMWRDFAVGTSSNTYIIQSFSRDPRGITWQIDVRPNGPPPREKRDWDTGRSEADVLRDGPDYVSIEYNWRTSVVGPVWAHFWGDGAYAGAQMLFTARSVRRYTDRDGTMGGLSGGLSLGDISRRLYPSQNWSFKAVDATGKLLAEGSFHPPDLARALKAYRAARSDIESADAAFRTSFTDQTVRTATCNAFEDPAASI